MNFDYSEKTQGLLNQLNAFMDEHVYPVEQQYHDAVASNASTPSMWQTPANGEGHVQWRNL